MTQSYPQQGYPQDPQVPQANPGQGMAIGGLVCALILGPLAFIGTILSVIALRKSKAVGMGNGVAIAGIIVSIIEFLASVVVIIVIIAGVIALGSACADLGPGIHVVGGVTYTCNI